MRKSSHLRQTLPKFDDSTITHPTGKDGTHPLILWKSSWPQGAFPPDLVGGNRAFQRHTSLPGGHPNTSKYPMNPHDL
jgi:hypothetical protein